jgi:hypothetical protein
MKTPFSSLSVEEKSEKKVINAYQPRDLKLQDNGKYQNKLFITALFDKWLYMRKRNNFSVLCAFCLGAKVITL